MKPKLGIIDKYRPMWEGGKSVEKYNVKVGFKIRMFVVSQITSQRQKNPNLLTQKDIEQLTKMIMELKQDKTTIPPEQQTCTLEEYQQFLSEFFSKVDYEDRHETVTMKTTSKFRLMASFIDVLSSWGPIDDEMIKCKKYCQYKAVDIFKALKKGEVSKRGGTKEQINNENENNNQQNNQYNDNNQNLENNHINENNNKNNQQNQNNKPNNQNNYKNNQNRQNNNINNNNQINQNIPNIVTKDDAGDYIFEIVEKIYKQQAGKITGMIIEFDLDKLKNMIYNDRNELLKQIDIAHNLLLQNNNK